MSDALKALRLTKDGENSFTIVDDKTEVIDRRPLRTDSSVVQPSHDVVAQSSNQSVIEKVAQMLPGAFENQAALPVDLNHLLSIQNQHPADSGYGSTISPSREQQSRPGDDGGAAWAKKPATYASEIFQVAAVNIFHQVEKDGLVYVQNGGKPRGKDTGELTIHEKTGEPAVDDAGKVIMNPNLRTADIGKVYDAIIGVKQGQITYVNADNFDGTYDVKVDSEHVSLIKDEKNLEQSLIYAKSQHVLPLILKVNSDCDPFYKDSNRHIHPREAEAHVVTITDFTLDKDGHISGVCIDNQWMLSADHDKNNSVSLHDLYVATLNSTDVIEALKADVNSAHGKHKNDYVKEMELVRLELLKNPKDADAQKDAKRLAQEAIQHYFDLPVRE
jgi:hypothetical protein